MTQKEQNNLGKTLWDIADQLRGAMNADDFRDYIHRSTSPSTISREPSIITASAT